MCVSDQMCWCHLLMTHDDSDSWSLSDSPEDVLMLHQLTILIKLRCTLTLSVPWSSRCVQYMLGTSWNYLKPWYNRQTCIVHKQPKSTPQLHLTRRKKTGDELRTTSAGMSHMEFLPRLSTLSHNSTGHVVGVTRLITTCSSQKFSCHFLFIVHV